MPNTFDKDPNAVLDYGIDWSTWLGDTDTILTSTWTVSNITKDSASKTNTTTKIWLSGGTVGTNASATNRIVTAEGRTEDRTLNFVIKER